MLGATAAAVRGRRGPPPPGGTVHFEIRGLFPLQQRFVYDPARVIWIGGGTKSGKTRGVATWLWKQACERGPGAYWWVGPWERTTKHGFGEIARLAQPFERRGLARIIYGDKRIETAWGAEVEARTGENPEALFGPKVKAAVVDEATRCREGVFDAIRSVTTPTNAPVRWLFNVDRGRRHWVIKKWLRAKAQATIHDPDGLAGHSPDGRVAYYHFPTSANPYIDPETIEEARSEMTERSFNALYLAEIQEDGAGVFRESDLDAISTLAGRKAHDPYGRYVCGVDLGKKQDYTVAIVIDTRKSEVVDWLRVTHDEYPKQIESVTALAKKFKATVVMEANGPGDPVIDFFRRQKGAPRVIPFVSSNTSKQQLIEELILGVEQRKIFLPRTEGEGSFPELGSEMLLYEYTYSKTGVLKYSAPEGFHDDCVIALALAWAHRGAAGGPFLYESETEGESRADQWRRSM